MTSGDQKSTVDEIRARFDADVERFSSLQTGQSATMDAVLAMDLVAEAAVVTTLGTTRILDVGCGAGNYTLKVLERLGARSGAGNVDQLSAESGAALRAEPMCFAPACSVTLVDLSGAMLQRAVERVGAATSGEVTAIQGDIREIELEVGTFDVILAAAVLHHLREEAEWRAVFSKFFAALRPGGSIWIFDLVESAIPAVQTMMWRRYGEYLTAFKGEEYRDHVLAYVEKEDSPRSVGFQLEMLRAVGFGVMEVLHKNGPFAAFGAVKR